MLCRNARHVVIIHNTHSKPKPHKTGYNKVSIATLPSSQDLGFVAGDCAPFLSDAVTYPIQLCLPWHSTNHSIKCRKNKREKLQNSRQISSVGKKTVTFSTNCNVQHRVYCSEHNGTFGANCNVHHRLYCSNIQCSA
jgi:hypothetical protein